MEKNKQQERFRIVSVPSTNIDSEKKQVNDLFNRLDAFLPKIQKANQDSLKNPIKNDDEIEIIEQNEEGGGEEESDGGEDFTSKQESKRNKVDMTIALFPLIKGNELDELEANLEQRAKMSDAGIKLSAERNVTTALFKEKKKNLIMEILFYILKKKQNYLL